jgi:hypothetical protein
MRINGIVVQDARVGRFYLLRREPLRGSPSYILSETPGHTNQSHRECFSGWLGTTNDVSWHAEGAVEVSQSDTGKWRVRLFNASELVESEEAERVVCTP